MEGYVIKRFNEYNDNSQNMEIVSEQNSKNDVIDLVEVYKVLKARKKVFFIVIPIVFVLSCIWVLPQPRYYKAEVVLAPEMNGEDMAGGLASVASQFGVSLGGGGTDAIYPSLYPDVVSSNEFIIGLLGVKVKSDDGAISTDYYTYMTKHQKKNWLTYPFYKMAGAIGRVFSKPKSTSGSMAGAKMNAFKMSEKDYNLVQALKEKITCDVDKKTDVITIGVDDQDPYIAACLADSVSVHRQNFITAYRTNKARIDVEHYRKLTEQSKKAYDYSVRVYSEYCDANQDVMLQSFISKRDEMENEMQLKFNTYSAMRTQYEAMLAKLQEKTPAFTTLQNATVPIRPSKPKRMIFVLGMCVLAVFGTSLWIIRKSIFAKSGDSK